MSWDPVYKLVKQIPRGRVLTYGAVARALRLPGGARTAGRAMAGCPSGKGIPWHRVLGAGGKLLIREPYASLQRKLLAQVPQKTSRAKKTIKINSSVPLKLRPKFRPAPFQSAAQQNVRMIPRLLILDAKPIRVFCRHTATRKFSLRFIQI